MAFENEKNINIKQCTLNTPFASAFIFDCVITGN